jgi:hypothetical protein
LILLTLLPALATRLRPREKRPSWTGYLPGLAVLLTMCHLVVEGYRWQMVPTYLLTGLLFTLSLIPFPSYPEVSLAVRNP